MRTCGAFEEAEVAGLGVAVEGDGGAGFLRHQHVLDARRAERLALPHSPLLVPLRAALMRRYASSNASDVSSIVCISLISRACWPSWRACTRSRQRSEEHTSELQ